MKKNIDRLVIVILVLGIFVQNFYIPLGGAKLKFFYLSFPLFVIEILLYKKVKKVNYEKVFSGGPIIVGTYMILTLLLIVFRPGIAFVEHFIFVIYMFFILFLNYYLWGDKLRFFRKPLVATYRYTVTIVMFLSIILYFYSIFVIGFDNIPKSARLENTPMATVFVEYLVLPRMNGFSLDPNYWGVNCIFAFWTVLITEKISRNKIGLSVKFSLTIIVISGILTYSRTFYLMIILTILSYLALVVYKYLKLKLRIRIKKKILVRSLVICLIFSFTGYKVISSFSIDNSISTVIEHKSNDVDDNPRLFKWKKYFNYIAEESLIVGFGYNRDVNVRRWGNIHNTYLDILFYNGVLGAGLFVLFIGIVILKIICISNYRIRSKAISFFIGLMFYVFFIDAYSTFSVWGSFIFLLAVAETKNDKVLVK